MLRKALVCLSVLLVPGWLAVSVAHADSSRGSTGNIAKDAGPFEITLGGSGNNDKSFRGGGAALSGSVGWFINPNLELAVRDSASYSDFGTGHSYSNTVQGVVDLHFNFDRIQPFIGGNIGYLTGTFVRSTGEGAPEAGIKLFLTDSTFLFGMAQYQFFFNNNSTTFSHGQFLYNVGLGLRF